MKPIDIPAFPSTHPDIATLGMTLRDYFAAKALHGFIAEPVKGVEEAMFINLSPRTCAALASAAYLMADAMLEERE